MKRELTGIKDELAKTRRVDDRLAAALVRLEAKFDGLGDLLDQKLKTALEPIHVKIDTLARMTEDSRYRWAVHADTLLEHDRRLKKLESRQ